MFNWFMDIFRSLADSFNGFIDSIQVGIDSITNFPAILPQLYNILPDSLTNVYLGIFLAIGFVGIFFALIKKEG